MLVMDRTVAVLVGVKWQHSWRKRCQKKNTEPPTWFDYIVSRSLPIRKKLE